MFSRQRVVETGRAKSREQLSQHKMSIKNAIWEPVILKPHKNIIGDSRTDVR